MAVKEANYSKEFIPKIHEEQIILNQEDCKMRDEINSKFGFHYDSKRGMGEGFDGKIWYCWSINDNVRSLKESSQNLEYQTTVNIRKAGAENEICFYSDLEKYLIANKFKELE